MSEAGLIDCDDDYLDFDRLCFYMASCDDKHGFIELVKGLGVCPPKVLYDIATYKAVGCATALLEGETDLTVDLNVPTLGGLYPLHIAAENMSYRLIELFLCHGARTNIKTKDSELVKGSLLPLNVALEMLRYHLYLVDWTPKDSVLKLIISLCLPKMKIPLDVNRLLACKTTRIVDVFYNYAMDGKLIEMAALLMVAREKVMAGFEGRVSIRQVILEEMASINDVEGKLMGCGKRGKWVNVLKGKRLVMTSALELLDVFEKAGDGIDAYVRSVQSEMTEQEVVKDITIVLKDAGFIQKSEDIYLSSIDCGSEKVKLEAQVSEKRTTLFQVPGIGLPIHSQSCSFSTHSDPVTDKSNEVAQSVMRFFENRSPLSPPATRFVHTSRSSKCCDILNKKTATRKTLPDLLSANTYGRFALLLKRGIRHI